MYTAIKPTAGYLRILTSCVVLALLAAPAPLIGQDFPRDELDEALDELATERAQELNEAYYEYEDSLEDLRREADREDRPELYTERRPELRSKLEERVLRIERNYEQRRAEVLLRHTNRGDRARPLVEEERFDRPVDEERPGVGRDRDDGRPGDGRPGVGRDRDDQRIAQLNDELARAWSEFHREAQQARQRARTDETWDGYEATITRLENEYEQQIADIQSRQRALRFEMERERRAQGQGRGVGEPDDE